MGRGTREEEWGWGWSREGRKVGRRWIVEAGDYDNDLANLRKVDGSLSAAFLSFLNISKKDSFAGRAVCARGVRGGPGRDLLAYNVQKKLGERAGGRGATESGIYRHLEKGTWWKSLRKVGAFKNTGQKKLAEGGGG